MNPLRRWKERAHQLNTEIYALYLAYRHPRTPLWAKFFLAGVVGYAFSPLDLIPDFIPLLGYLDDLVLLPIGVALALRMIPPEVMAECRAKARMERSRKKGTNWTAAAVVALLWLLLAAVAILALARAVRR